MRKRGLLSRRPSASRPKTALQRELTTKRRGELAELAFTLKAASLGFGVAKPYGDSERYDFILDARNAHSSAAYVGTAALGCPGKQSSPVCHPEKGALCPTKDPGSPRESSAFCADESIARSAGILSSRALTTGTSSLYRVQVKCSTQLLDGLYRVNGHRRIHGRAVPYLPSEIDFFAAFIIPEDTWYIIPIHSIRGTSLLFRRKRDRKPGIYDQYREAWHRMRQNDR